MDIALQQNGSIKFPKNSPFRIWSRYFQVSAQISVRAVPRKTLRRSCHLCISTTVKTNMFIAISTRNIKVGVGLLRCVIVLEKFEVTIGLCRDRVSTSRTKTIVVGIEVRIVDICQTIVVWAGISVMEHLFYVGVGNWKTPFLFRELLMTQRW